MLFQKLTLSLFILSASLTIASAQERHTMPMSDSAKMLQKEGSMNGMRMNGMDMAMNMKMANSLSLNLPMSRNGSGTAWSPDATTIYGYMMHAKEWMFMFHGNIFVRYNRQDFTGVGSRGGERWDAPDMLMAMAQHTTGKKGLFHFNLMMSTDAIVTGGFGYPLLYQTGESWQGQPLVDRQHPHDLFSEVSVSYAYALNEKSDLYLYVGYPGEPAIGPVTFMHRPSGMFNPDAPISHHWEDATHITFGVATVGYRFDQFKLEGSSFTGREPDENRFNFDKPRFDSWSARLSFNPSSNWAVQISHAFIKSPEALRPDENVNRTTASATYVKVLGSNADFSATLLWGQNKVFDQGPSNAVLFEANLKLKKLDVYIRYEWVQKSVEELNLDAGYGKNDFLFDINTVTIGASYDLFNIAHMTVAGGAQLSVFKSPTELEPLYGDAPLAGEIYLHFYPRRMK